MTMLCPMCLADVTFKQQNVRGVNMYLCPMQECSQPVPALYVKDYAKYPPVVVSAVGFRQHGKTVYFAALFHLLKKMRMARHWQQFFTMGLDEESLRIVYENVGMLEGGNLPPATPANFQRPTLVRVEGIPLQPNCTLVCYDTGGESFEKASQLVRNARFVARAKTAMILLSIPDLADPARELQKLLNTYIVGMAELGADTRDQHLSVVFTKADQMGDRLARWGDLSGYLSDGAIENLAHPQHYYDQMQLVSDRLMTFTRTELEADEFLNATRSYFKSVSFSIVSALGARPQGSQLTVQVMPRRVLDPVLWMIQQSLPDPLRGVKRLLRKVTGV